VGAAAALGAGSARNSAVVLALWVLATAAAVASRGRGETASRWAVTLCAADLPVVGAVAWAALQAGFEQWPAGLDGPAVVLLLVSAVLRAPLASGPDDDGREPGLLVVRTQMAVLVLVGLAATDISRIVLVVAAIAGAAAFAAAGTAARAATRDVVQEAALLLVVAAAGRLHWAPAGWDWGVLAGGTLMHNLRLRSESIRPLAGQILNGGGIGLPLLAGVLVALEASARARGWQGALLMLGLAAGMWARAAGARDSVVVPRPADDRWGRWTAVGVCAAALVAGLWAPILTRPAPAAGAAIGWPPAWALAAVLGAGAIGGWRRPHGPARAAEAERRMLPVVGDLLVPVRWARPAAISGALALLAGAAVALYAVGVLRGFL
jgi:hypothetical protein